MSNTPTRAVNVTIRRKGGGADKENLTEAEQHAEVDATSKAKKVGFVFSYRIYSLHLCIPQKKKALPILPGNVNRAENVLILKERWVCNVRSANCLGAYCYVFPDTKIHLPLNHERLECWASAMVVLT